MKSLHSELRKPIADFLLAYVKQTNRITLSLDGLEKNLQKAVLLKKYGLETAILKCKDKLINDQNEEEVMKCSKEGGIGVRTASSSSSLRRAVEAKAETRRTNLEHEREKIKFLKDTLRKCEAKSKVQILKAGMFSNPSSPKRDVIVTMSKKLTGTGCSIVKQPSQKSMMNKGNKKSGSKVATPVPTPNSSSSSASKIPLTDPSCQGRMDRFDKSVSAFSSPTNSKSHVTSLNKMSIEELTNELKHVKSSRPTMKLHLKIKDSGKNDKKLHTSLSEEKLIIVSARNSFAEEEKQDAGLKCDEASARPKSSNKRCNVIREQTDERQHGIRLNTSGKYSGKYSLRAAECKIASKNAIAKPRHDGKL